MASLAAHPHPPAGIHSTHTHATLSSPTSCPQPPPQPTPSPRALSAFSLPPAGNTTASSSSTSPASSTVSSTSPSPTPASTATSADPPQPVRYVFTSMLDVDLDKPLPKRPNGSVSSSSSTPAQRSRQNSIGPHASEKEISRLALSPVATTPANLPSRLTPDGPDPADKALPRLKTSPSLLKLAAPAAPRRPPPGPPAQLQRGKSERNLNSNKRLPDPAAPTPTSSTPSSTPVRRPSAGSQTPSTIRRLGSFFSSKKSQRNSYPGQDVTVRATPPTTQSSVSTQKSKSRGPSVSSSQSPVSSPATTPPSSRSRENTIMDNDSIAPDQLVPADTTTINLDHSISASSMLEHTRTATPRVGITWGPNFTEDGYTMDQPPRQRRRSISQDNLSFGFNKKDRDPDAPAELMATFSFRSSEGVGLKARRLSTAIPEDFHIRHCELNKEYVPSSHIPFSRGRMVGKGATAVVRLMQRRNDPTRALFAVKEYRGRDKSEPEDEYVKKVKSEYSIAHSLKHPNIVRSVALCTHHGRWNNVMEYCQFGEMFHWVEKGTFQKQFKLEDRNCFFKQLIRGVDYLHSHGIAHRDIKLENLLLTAEGHLKITDFGVSDVFCGQHPGLRTSEGKCGQNMGSIRRCSPGICGSLPYIAPEVLNRNTDYDPRALDVWSCAIVYLTMTYGGGPWSEASSKDQLYSRFLTGWNDWYETHPDGEITDAPKGSPILPGMFSSKNPMGLTSITSPAMRRLILKMLNPYPENRVDIHSVLMSNLVKGIDCCTPESCDEEGRPIERQPTDCSVKNFKKHVVKKHNHIPPKEHKTPLFFQHRFDMGDGYR